MVGMIDKQFKVSVSNAEKVVNVNISQRSDASGFVLLAPRTSAMTAPTTALKQQSTDKELTPDSLAELQLRWSYVA